ncbi:MAG: cyclase family protein [Solirubrobacteraceae bacterium]
MSNWGRWGDEDQRGALNLIDADAVLRGVACVRTGDVLSLATPIRSGAGSSVVGRPAAQHFMLRDGGDYAAGRPERGGFGFADDCVMLATHGATHIDALSHVWRDGRIYNGFSAGEIGSSGAHRCGIEHAGPIVTRAVFVDLVPDGSAALPPGAAVGLPALLERITAGGVEPQAGDALLIRTGWTEEWQRGEAGFDAWPGLDADCAEWIAACDIALVGADNVAVEVFPSTDPECQVPLHVALLRDRGVPLCELLDLAGLAASGRRTCLLVIAPLPLVGAVGSPINPVAVL